MAGAAGSAPSAPPFPAQIPATLNCGGAQPVWVNKRSRAYHLPTDPAYGRTKHGTYMCPDAAMAAGYHEAGTHGRYRKTGTMNNASAEPTPAAT
jgi:hypothetical protein